MHDKDLVFRNTKQNEWSIKDYLCYTACTGNLGKKIKHPREKDDKTDNRCLRKQNKGQVLNQFLKVRHSKSRDRRREKSTSNDRHVCTRCFGVWLK